MTAPLEAILRPTRRKIDQDDEGLIFITPARAREIREEIDRYSSAHRCVYDSECHSRGGTARFYRGWLCPAHSPRVPVPDPAMSAVGLRRRLYQHGPEILFRCQGILE